MENNNYYTIYGINIKSDIELPELVKVSSENPNYDVTIKLGITPKSITNPLKIGVRYQAKKNELLLFVDNIANYYIVDGNLIVIEKLNNSTDSELRLFLLGSAFGALLFQRKIVPFHASSVKINNKATVISGVSGAGKSTIIANLINKGYTLIADDISPINISDNNFFILPGFPRVKLWLHSIELLSMSNNFEKIRPQLEKYSVIVDNFYNEKCIVDNIFIIKPKNYSKVTIKEIKGIEKFKNLTANIYRKQFTVPLNVEKEQFDIISKLSTKVRLYVIERPTSGNSIDEVSEKIISASNAII